MRLTKRKADVLNAIGQGWYHYVDRGGALVIRLKGADQATEFVGQKIFEEMEQARYFAINPNQAERATRNLLLTPAGLEALEEYRNGK